MGWKNKVLVVLIVYFMGFATAIYALAPASTKATGPIEPNHPKSFSQSFAKSDDFAGSFNSGMRKCLAAASAAAVRTGEFIKTKLASNKETRKNAAGQ